MRRKISIALAMAISTIVLMLAFSASAYTFPSDATSIYEADPECAHKFVSEYAYYPKQLDCTKEYNIRYNCEKCGSSYYRIRKAGSHKIVSSIVEKAKPRTTTSNGTYGYIEKKCSKCDYYYDYVSIAPPAEYKLSYNSYQYDGKAKKPSVTIRDANGNKISTKYYTLEYSNNIKPGKANVKITFSGRYSGRINKAFKIKPKKATLSSVSYVSKGKISVKWKKVSNASGYIVQYSTSQGFAKKNTCTIIVSSNSTLSKSITTLPAKKYYVRVAAYTAVGSSKYKGAWSDKKSTTVKKGASLKEMINHTKTDLSGRSDILLLTKDSVDIKKYKTTYDRLKAIYNWHSKNNTKYFANCMECNMNFNDCVFLLYGTKKQYDNWIWLAAGDFKNNDGSVVMHKWSVLYIQGVPYIFDPRLQGYSSNKTGTDYFGVPSSSKLKKKYLFDGWMIYWSNDADKKIV